MAAAAGKGASGEAAHVLSTRLRELRERLDLDIPQLASRANVRPAALTALEAGDVHDSSAYMRPATRAGREGGERPLPRMDVLCRLAAALEVDYEELFALADYPQALRDLWTLGATIREQRTREHIRAEELADRAAVSAVYLWILERGADPKTGRPSRPSPERLKRLARELGLDADRLLALAGHPSGGGEDPVDRSEQLNAVSQTNRIKPAVLKWLALLEHSEQNFDGWVNYNVMSVDSPTPGVVELPVWLFLRHAPRREDLVIVGVSFRAQDQPAVLVKRRGRSFPDRDLTELPSRADAWAGLRVGVFGLATTSTVLLLAHLRKHLGLTPRLYDLATDGELARKVRDRFKHDEVLLDVSYTAGGLFERVLRDELDLALLPRHSYILDKRRALLLGSEPDPFSDLYFDPWPQFHARTMPQTLLVSTHTALERHPHAIADSLEQIRRACADSSERATRPEPQRGVPEAPALDLRFSGDVVVDDVDRLAAELTWEAELLAAAGQEGLKPDHDWRRRIVPRQMWGAKRN